MRLKTEKVVGALGALMIGTDMSMMRYPRGEEGERGVVLKNVRYPY